MKLKLFGGALNVVGCKGGVPVVSQKVLFYICQLGTIVSVSVKPKRFIEVDN